MTHINFLKVCLVPFVALVLVACSVVELGGKLMRRTGETLSDYSKENDGVIGKGAGIAGGVYSSVGAATEDAARGSKGDQPAASARPATPAAGASNANSPSNSSHATAEASASPLAITITEAQRRLTELGYRPGPIDGSMGKRTVDALLQFQRSSGLSPSGKLDVATSDALRKATRPKQ